MATKRVLGNGRVWETPHKEGRDKIFATPQLMWEAATEFFKWCDANPLLEQDYRQGKYIYLQKKRPYTLISLSMYLGTSEGYWRQFKHERRKALREKGQKIDEQFLAVMTQIEKVIYDQKFIGAATGFFNANLISMDLGMRAKVDIDLNDEPEKRTLTDEEIDERLSKLLSKGQSET